MVSKTKILLVLFLILVLAAFLRFYRVTQHDVINDEVFYGYRSIGLVDSLNSPAQATPFEWYDPVPAWAKLSFHDHPPLGFWIQHLFFKIFGSNLWGLRLPFVLAGIFSVWLVFLISRRLFNEQVGLVAALILALNNYHVFISRIGLQESLVIFFMLLAIWLFTLTPHPSLLGGEGGRRSGEGMYFYLSIVAIGLAILTKYTGVILLPIFLFFLLWKQRDLLTSKRIIISTVLLLVMLSPVIIYNLKLYAERGHFDFQISYLLKQNVPDWQERPGREVGGLAARVDRLVNGFAQGHGIIFSVLTLIAVLSGFRFRKDRAWQFLALVFLFLILLLLFIGPQERFLAMLTPILSVMVAAWVVNLSRKKSLILAIFGILLALELAFAVNTNLLVIPKGQEKIHYAILRRESNLWGYNQLEEYLTKKMAGRYAPQTFPLKFEFARDLSDKAIARAKQAGKIPYQILFVVDSNISGFASLWYATRHTIYDGWPILSDNAFWGATGEDPEFFTKQGFEEIIFVKAGDTLLRPDRRSETSLALEQRFQGQGIKPGLITSPLGKTAFRIYEIANTRADTSPQ